MENDKILDVLGLPKTQSTEIELIDENKNSIIPSLPNNENDEYINDIETTQENLKDIIDLGNESLRELVSIAKASQSPMAFDALSKLIKTLSDTNKDYLGVSEKKKKTKEETPKHEQLVTPTNVTNNNLILSTTDLLKMLKGDQK